MAGHSKWANTKHRKAKVDEARAKIFGRLIREVTVAARGGVDSSTNSKLRLAILKAKSVSVPSKNIEAAINKGFNEKDSTNCFELLYEGYGAHGVSILVESLTDNKTRTVSNIRFIFNKHQGNMGETGSVSWMFDSVGNIIVEKKLIEEDALLDIILDVGADDLISHEEVYEITCNPKIFHQVLEALDQKKLKTQYAEVIRKPQNTIQLSKSDAEKIHSLIEALENDDDVQNVYSNLEEEK